VVPVAVAVLATVVVAVVVPVVVAVLATVVVSVVLSAPPSSAAPVLEPPPQFSMSIWQATAPARVKLAARE
jgi:hypothetical protein